MVLSRNKDREEEIIIGVRDKEESKDDGIMEDCWEDDGGRICVWLFEVVSL